MISKRQLLISLFPMIIIGLSQAASSSSWPPLSPYPGDSTDQDDYDNFDDDSIKYPRYSNTIHQRRRELENSRYLESFGQWWQDRIEDFPFRLVYNVAPRPVNIKLSYTLRPFKMLNIKGLMIYNCHDQVAQFQGSCDVERIGTKITLMGQDEITLFKKFRLQKGTEQDLVGRIRASFALKNYQFTVRFGFQYERLALDHMMGGFNYCPRIPVNGFPFPIKFEPQVNVILPKINAEISSFRQPNLVGSDRDLVVTVKEANILIDFEN